MYSTRRDKYGLSVIYEEHNIVCKIIESSQISREVIEYISKNQKKIFR